MPKKKEKLISIRNYKNYDIQKFCEEMEGRLKESNLQTLIDNNEVNEAMNTYSSILQQVIENNAPMKEIKIHENKNKVPWFTEE